jgi:hypothetical protein
MKEFDREKFFNLVADRAEANMTLLDEIEGNAVKKLENKIEDFFNLAIEIGLFILVLEAVKGNPPDSCGNVDRIASVKEAKEGMRMGARIIQEIAGYLTLMYQYCPDKIDNLMEEDTKDTVEKFLDSINDDKSQS